MKTLEPFLAGVAFLGGVALLAVMASTMFGGCNSGSEIPIDPTCIELVTDECVPEVIAEFCDECETCPPPVVCPPPRVCPPPACFVKHVEKVCVRERYGRCCEWEKAITFEPIDCPEPDTIVVP